MPLNSGEELMPVGVLGQTVLLFKKSFLSKIRQEPKKLAGEIFIPILYLGLLCLLIGLQNIEIHEEVKTSMGDAQPIMSSLNPSRYPTATKTVHIVPDNDDVKNFSQKMNQILARQSQNLAFTFVASETKLMELYQAGNVSLAIVFARSGPGGRVVFNNFTIRVNPDLSPLPAASTKKAGLETCRSAKIDPPESPSTCAVNAYFYANFLALQSLVEQTFLETESGQNLSFTVTIDTYPKAEYTAGLPAGLRILIPLYSVIPLSQFINNLLVLIVTEKEAKIKDGLRMIGVSDAAYWMSWFGVYSIIIFILSLMFTIVMHFMKVLYNLNPLILFSLFFTFGLSVITLAFALTPFFHKPKTAGVVGTLVLQVTSLLFMLQTFLASSTEYALIPLRIISSLAFTTAMDQACAYEYFGGIGWSDLTFGGRGQGILISLIFMVCEIFGYALLAVYLDNIIPNQFGVRKHPLYIFMPYYWLGSGAKDGHEGGDRLLNESGNDSWVEEGDDIEPISLDLVGKEAIKIRHIKKTYFKSWSERKGVTVLAVKDISLNIYADQITAILGRNGAGKSTLFNMLIGLVSPTSGSCNIFGFDIRNPFDMTKVRKMTGVCLQYDLHFDALTVDEHLQFYGKLRGLKAEELDGVINGILTDLRLKDKRTTHASKLSGGQKRKLSVGIALIGDPKIILLDEPTAGVDPVSRRHLWDLLQRRKHGKVILLTTHFMDEADILADRKVIVHDGITKCIGSSLFLKNRFGVGYYLTIELKDRNTPTSECDALIQKWVPVAIDSKKVIASEVKYSLPQAAISSFVPLFAELEETQSESSGGIKSYGVAMTTLEDVFLKISNDAVLDSNETAASDPDRSYGASDEQNLIGDFGAIEIKSLSVFWSMCKLRILRLRRSPQALFFMVLVPVILGAVGVYLVRSSKPIPPGTSAFLSDAKGMYSPSELNLAVFQANESLKVFLRQAGFTIHDVDGDFEALLNVNQPQGTMAGINVSSDTANDFQVILMINGTFEHSTPIVTASLQAYFERNVFNRTTELLSIMSVPFVSTIDRPVDVAAFYLVFILAPAFVFTSVGMVIEVVSDREIRARNHLRVNGLTFRMYFSSIFAVFGTLAIIVTIMQFILIAAFKVEAFLNPYAFFVAFVLLLLYIPSSLIFSAAFSYLFNKMESAQAVFSQVASWSGTIPGLAIAIMDLAGVKESIVFIVHALLSFVDVFYIPFGVLYFVYKPFFKQQIMCHFTTSCDDLNLSSYMTWDIFIMLFALLIQIPVFILLLTMADIMKDGGSILKTFQGFFRSSPVGTERPASSDSIRRPTNPLLRRASLQGDDDIQTEAVRVREYFAQGSTNPACVVAVERVVKHYKVKVKVEGDDDDEDEIIKNVVNGVSLMVEEGEVFGLLGHNGAGKTTTMKIITAEEHPNEGRVALCGYDIKSNMSKAFVHLGYCPQHDVLWENITIREHLKFYSTIRGILPENRDRLVDHFLRGLKITEHADKRASDLSGGTKRKLSYAISMLGAPRVVLMDEPSTGMDPQSKRFLWNTVLGTFRESRGAILTTHSMEEADALCTRIAIMVKGSLLCIGSPQHLKTKFGAGYTLEVKLKDHPGETIDLDQAHLVDTHSVTNPEITFAFVKESFPASEITECFGNRAIFAVPTAAVQSLSKTFSLLENMKQEGKIQEYSFSQTTLEQVFLAFARGNEENEES